MLKKIFDKNQVEAKDWFELDYEKLTEDEDLKKTTMKVLRRSEDAKSEAMRNAWADRVSEEEASASAMRFLRARSSGTSTVVTARR